MNARSFATGLALVLLAAAARAAAPVPHARIAALYVIHCESCHGERGDGYGPASSALLPRPRDFALGEFKLRTSAPGENPTDADLERTVRRGVPGTAMPAYRARLSAAEIRGTIAVLKSFSPRFDVDGPAVPVTLPAAPRSDRQTLERGRAEDRRLDCARCHGESGRGDGPAAAGLRDATCFLTRPRDLTVRRLFKGGSGPADVFRTLSFGLDGTPMPGHEARIPVAARWDLARYVSGLAR